MNALYLVKNYLFMIVLFFTTTLLSVKYHLDILLANLCVLILFVVSLNIFKQNLIERIFQLFIGIVVLGISFFVNTKIYTIPLFLAFMGGIYWFNSNKDDAFFEKFIIFIAIFFNLSFISNSKIMEVQYDFPSCYNYIEYILENNFLFWQENPLLSRPSYSTYHPILHFFLAAIGIKLGTFLTNSVEAANEGLQIFTLSYMLWYYIISSKILKLLNINGILYRVSLLFISFFPIYNAISGFINNDALLLPLQAMVIYYSLLYLKTNKKENLFYIFVFITLSCLVKLSGVLMLGGVSYIFLIELYNNRNKETFFKIFKFSVFILLGISIWPIYQYFVLDYSFYAVPPQTHLSLEEYSLWERYSPFRAFFYERMFYNDFGSNLWETMTKTALFGQWDFSYKGAKIMWLIKLMIFLYKIVIATSIASFGYIAIKEYKNKYTWLLLCLILSVLSGHIMFSVKHPYMCNQDFRYVGILALLISCIIGRFLTNMPKVVQQILVTIIILFAIVSQTVWWYISL